jgi:hypothetical protein
MNCLGLFISTSKGHLIIAKYLMTSSFFSRNTLGISALTGHKEVPRCSRLFVMRLTEGPGPAGTFFLDQRDPN